MQRTTLAIYLLLFFLASTRAESVEKCMDSLEEVEECTDTEYHSYVECMRRRSKRSTDCNRSCDDCGSSDNCGDCDCNYCSYNECSSNCNSCCQLAPPPCQTRSCCHQTCNSQCRTISCRRRCRSRCQSKITTSTSGSSSLHTATNTNANISAGVKAESKHNITTVINLHNVINNTNIIDMPITLNNTNINNITVEAAEGGGGSTNLIVKESEETHENTETDTDTETETEKENCCKIVGPRQCMQIKTFPFMKCFHYRRQHCGELCKTAIMHAEPHEVCDQTGTGSPSCHQQVAYIPQPQPRCTYTTQWPYVSCNVMPQNCGGCYKHVVHGGNPPAGCHQSCYDQGFNVGPLYRPGPFYQPGFGMPNCATGNCEGAGFGGIGQQVFSGIGAPGFTGIGQQAFAGMGQPQGYYGYENPMENMMQVEPSPEGVQHGDIQHG